MFRFTRKPSSGNHNQNLAKNRGLIQCRYRRPTDVVSVMVAYYELCGLCVVHCVSVYCASGTVYAYAVHNTQAKQAIICRHKTDNVCTKSVSTLIQACVF